MRPDSDSSDSNAGFHFSVSHFVLNRSFERSCSDIRSLLTPGLGVWFVARLHHQISLSADDPFANSTTLPGNIKSTVSRPSLASVVESITDAHPPQTSASAARDYTPLLDGEGCPHQAEASPFLPRRNYATGATKEEQEIYYLKYQRPPSKTKQNGKRVRPPLHHLSACDAASCPFPMRGPLLLLHRPQTHPLSSPPNPHHTALSPRTNHPASGRSCASASRTPHAKPTPSSQACSMTL